MTVLQYFSYLFDRLNYYASNNKLQFVNSDDVSKDDDDDDDDDETNNNNIGTGIRHSFRMNAFLCTNGKKHLHKMLKKCIKNVKNFQNIIFLQFRIGI